MTEEPVRHQYHPKDREEVFDLLRVSYPADVAAYLIAQWAWKYEANPFNPPRGPTVDIIRIGSKLVSMVAGMRLRMWMGGIECFGEARCEWLVHPEHRGHHLWRRVGTLQPADIPVLFGWSRIPGAAALEDEWVSEPITPLLRVVDCGPLIEHFTNSRSLASIGAAASAAGRIAGAGFRRAPGNRNRAVVRLNAFDGRVDALFDRARRAHLAMVVRDHSYLNWRYVQRPDASYTLYGVEYGSELAGFLVIRIGSHLGMRWGYLVDFLVHENSDDVLSSLIDAALDEFRRSGVAAVSCYATDRAVRRTLFRHGFLPFPRRKPIHFNRSIRADRPDLAKFKSLRHWYVTMGDGDFEMAF